jgi:hypothetical protein
MAQAAIWHACDRDLACGRDSADSGPARTQDVPASVPRSSGVRRGRLPALDLPWQHHGDHARRQPPTIGRVSRRRRPGLPVPGRGPELRSCCMRSGRLHVCGRARSTCRPACAQGSALLHNAPLARPGSGSPTMTTHRAIPTVLLPSREDRRHASRSAQDGLGTYLT